ncbi:hypothetical protein [Pseudoalteromonas luteoviolacea]|uniref:DUF4440 domain-containing protein n=1 Tax=Pseudoalteromonas luteoviolacea S4054 TaxID=1129367 RepID=A0A0F6AI77_9GAMM|nr:hypothetical protein [Pseudoalteromonas luteoviolacea]AOT07898.1 hypothetical protein S4054249_08605 [Pseudoalteromonas luteoviolacea]AOT12814.1 hypothetical protein S40542_08605 [Pseudoalteromonas luteoviolacea]AOT17727.1 hypothetical protein S4054_08600 [Pseudoalteromonas luteoviolacea]KKE85863.1 hypothetical protein N479_00385 [Pseudoalteromonas luteoviolacea S4054]KZN74741.1 hypothetical protein N481_08765 [Pseudoalteromonas luteoviolacea S4047-1]
MRFSFMLFVSVLSNSASASSAPEEVVGALFEALSHAPKEKPDIEKLKALFHAEAKIFGVQQANAKSNLMAVSGAEFITLLDKVPEKGFFECEVVRKVQRYDRFAQVYSVAETRFNKDQKKPDFTGVNSIQLYKQENEWQILSLYYQIESPSNPISLEGAKSGACL